MIYFPFLLIAVLPTQTEVRLPMIVDTSLLNLEATRYPIRVGILGAARSCSKWPIREWGGELIVPIPEATILS
jgi:hypothetical protein